MSWLLPPNKSASITWPVGPSKTYSFWILTQGNLRRCRFNSSRSFENFFSLTRSFLRATSHSFCETTLRFSIPWTVLILGITLDLSVLCLFVRSNPLEVADMLPNFGNGSFDDYFPFDDFHKSVSTC